jgi:hypothetical protein
MIGCLGTIRHYLPFVRRIVVVGQPFGSKCSTIDAGFTGAVINCHTRNRQVVEIKEFASRY